MLLKKLIANREYQMDLTAVNQSDGVMQCSSANSAHSLGFVALSVGVH